jgi:hypothetical protein
MQRASAIWTQHTMVDRDQCTSLMGLFEATKTLRNFILQVSMILPMSRDLELGCWRDWSFLSAIPKGLDRLKIEVMVLSIWATVLIQEDFRDVLLEEIGQVLDRKFDCDKVEKSFQEIPREIVAPAYERQFVVEVVTKSNANRLRKSCD